MRCRFHLLMVATLLMGCQKEKLQGNDPGSSWTTHLNVPYGSDGRQKMDIYLPAGRSTASTRVIILIHGGAWSTGDKSDFAPYVDTLKQRLPDYAIFNINYRLAATSVNLFPTQENDVKAAFDFIAGKTDEYNISKKIVLLGASAGGHLALLQGYKNPAPLKVKAIVDFFGPTDMADMYNHPLNPMFVPALEALFNGTPSTQAALYEQSSPIRFVNPASPPTIILQGGLDPLVAVSQSTSLDAELQAKGVAHEYVFYPAEGHGWVGVNLTHSFNKIQAFLETHVN